MTSVLNIFVLNPISTNISVLTPIGTKYVILKPINTDNMFIGVSFKLVLNACAKATLVLLLGSGL